MYTWQRARGWAHSRPDAVAATIPTHGSTAKPSIDRAATAITITTGRVGHAML